MIIGIDLDDVLADFWTHMLVFYNARHGTAFTKNDFLCYDSWKTWGCTRREAITIMEEFYATDAFMEIPPVEGAEEAVARLAEHHVLCVVTGRPDHLIPKTKIWMRSHFSGMFQAEHHTNAYAHGRKPRQKKEVLKTLGAHLLIEDHIDHALPCAEEGIGVLLVDQPWNQSAPVHENMIRVSSWKEIVEEVHNLERVQKITQARGESH